MWRSLVARVVRDDEVAGSNPVIPTNPKPPESNFQGVLHIHEQESISTYLIYFSQ